MNLADVRDRVTADDQGKWDRVIEQDELRLQDGRLRLPRSSDSESSVAISRGLRLTDWATSQMCQKLGIPTAYFRRCPVPLQDAQVNHWLHRGGGSSDGDTEEDSQQQQQKRWLIRVKADTARGILSERYARLSNTDVLACLVPALREAPYQVDWFSVTDESMHLRLFDPRLSREVLPGDRGLAGLHIGNSEVGRRAVTVDALVYRLVCKNGLVRLVKGKSLLHHRHLGFTKAELEQSLGFAIGEALVQATGFMERMHQATREYVPNVDEMLSKIASDAGLSQKTEEDVKASLEKEPRHQRDTLYGLVNALTFTAQGMPPDDRYALETLAGGLLETGVPRNAMALSRRGEVEVAGTLMPPPSPPLLSLFGTV